MKNKKIVLVAIILISAVAAFLLARQGAQKPAAVKVATEGLSAPDFALQDMGGKTWKLSSMEGTVVIVNFWATWCESCRLEMPALQKLYETNKTNDKLQILTILFRDDPARADAYLKQYGYNFPVLIDSEGTTYKKFGLTGVPETFIIDKGGVLRKKILGPVDFVSPDATEYFRGLIEG